MQNHPANLSSLQPGDHGCFLYETEEEHRNVLGRFLRHGLEQNHKILYILDTHSAEQILAYLKNENFNAEQAVNEGQLSFLTAETSYLKENVFDPDAVIAFFRQETARALEEGYAALRATSGTAWTRADPPGSERLFEYEAKLNAFFSENPAIGLCQYHRQQFQPETLQDILRTHPIAVIGKEIYPNSYYLPPSEMLEKSRAQTELDTWINNLVENKNTKQEQSLVLDNVAETIAHYDTQQNIYWTNVAYEKAVGKSLSALKGTKCFQAWGLDRPCKDCPVTKAIESGEQCETELTPENQPHWPADHSAWMIKATPLTDQKGQVTGAVEIATDITEQHQTKRALEYRLEFEERICALSTRLINCAHEDFDQCIHDALASIGEFVGAGRAYFFQFHDEQKLMSNTHEWCAEGVSSQIDDIQNFPPERLPWLMHKLRSQEIIHIARLDELPKEAANLRDILERQHIKSLIVVPMIYQGELVGFFGFDAVEEETEWSADTILLLQTAGEILVNALQRQKMEEALEKNRKRYEGLLESQTELVVRVDPQYRFTYVNSAYCRTFGKSREELRGTPFMPLVHEDDLDDTLAAMEDLHKPPHRVHMEERAETVDGLRWLEWDDNAILNQAGEIVEIQGVGRDITERKHAEKALRESEEKYRNLTENTLDILYNVDKDGIIQYIGPQIEQYGFEQQKLEGKTFLNILHPDDKERTYSDFLKTINEGEVFPSEFRIQTPDGKIYYFEERGDIKRDSTGAITNITGVIRDVTERKQTEEALRQSEENHRRFFETIDDMIVVHDTDGNIMEGNPALMQKLGYTLDELQQMHVVDLHPNDVRSQAQDIFYAVHNGEQTSFHLPLAHKDGTYIPAETRFWFGKWNGVDCILSICKDLTREQEAQERFERVFRNNPALMTLMSLPERRFVDVNDTFLNKLGYRKQELIDTPANEIGFLPKDQNQQALVEELQNEGRITERELQIVTKTGEFIDVLVSGDLFATQGERYMLWVLIDVTERNRVKASLEQAYAELNRKHQQLVHQERQRALTTMVSGIAHNFNNALAPIQASADLLINVPKTRRDDAKLCYYLKHIQSCTQRAAEIIRRLRRFYRPGEQNTFSDFNLNQIISEAVASTEPRWKEEAEAGGRDINVRTEFGDLPLARGNESEIHEVVTNLIFNAVDAMPEGGEIRIKTEARDQNVLLEFCDTGIGMAEETRQNCLDPFYTTKGPQESGLGLATLESIVQRHDGEISIESEPNKGTTFRITLPTAQREETTHSEESAAIPQAANILVVENEESQRTTLQDVLSIDGHKTDVASDGVEALERYDPSSYDLIITDRAMPQMSGDQFAARVKETAPETPIVMLTGFADMMDASGENPPNLDAFISKPVTQEKLRETIEQML